MMIVSPIKAHIKTRFRLARTPRRLNWRDRECWTTSRKPGPSLWCASMMAFLDVDTARKAVALENEALMTLELSPEQIAARDQELAEWDDSWPAVPYDAATAAPAVPDAKEDRSAEALRTIKALRDEAGLVTTIIAPALAERLVLGNGDLTS